MDPQLYGQLIFDKSGKISNGKKTVSSISGGGKIGQLYRRMKLDHSLTLYTKINSKWPRKWK